MRQFRQLDQRGGRTSSLRVPKLLMFGVWLVVGTLANPAANPPTKKQADYRDWIASYLKGPLQMYDASKDRVVDVVVTYTAVGYVDLKSRSDAVIEVGCGVAADGTTVGANGQVGFFHEDCGGGRSGGYAAISDENLKKLRGLLSKLPDDHSQLPPAGRRLVVQVRSGTRVLARVYDRTDLPDKVLEILRLSNSGILSWAPKFDPRGQWKIGQDSETYGAIAFPVDGKQIITARLDGINVWDAETHALVKSFPYSPMCVSSTIFPGLPYHLVFSPDGLTAIIGDYGDLDVRDSRSWEGIKSLRDIHLPYLLHPQFSPDGSCLFVESGQSELLVFDTKTWERRGPLPETPTDAIAYFPSSNGQRAVYISKSGAIKLWEPQKRRDVALLENGRVVSLSFSPDQSLVAVVVAHDDVHPNQSTVGDNRVGVWRTDKGTLLRELRPFESPGYFAGDLRWWPNGKYLMGTEWAWPNGESGIGIWDVKSGRFRGEFSGCGGRFEISAGRKELAALCGDTATVWDGASAIQKIESFTEFDRH